MRRILALILSLFVIGNTFSQTTNFSLTSIPYGAHDIVAPGRGLNTWFIHSEWPNDNSIKRRVYPNAHSQDTWNSGDSTVTHGTDLYIRSNWGQIEAAGSGSTPASSNRWDFNVLKNPLHWAIDRGMKLSFGILPIATGYTAYGTVGGAALPYPTWLHNTMQALPSADRDYISDGTWIPNWNSTAYKNAHDTLMGAIANWIDTGSYTPSTGPKAGIQVFYQDVILRVDIRGYGNSGEWTMSGLNSTSPPGNQALTYSTAQALVNSHIAKFPKYNLQMMMECLDIQPSGASSGQFNYWILTQTNAFGRIGWNRDNVGQGIFNATLECNPLSYNPGSGSVTIQSLINDNWKHAPNAGEPSSNSPTVAVPHDPTKQYWPNSWCGPCDLNSHNASFCTNDYPGGTTVYYWGDMGREARDQHLTQWGNGNYGSGTLGSLGIDSIHVGSKANGYRLVWNAGYMTTTLIQNTNFTFSLSWRNIGVTPVYDNWNTVLELQTSGGSVVNTWTLGFKVKGFLPSASDSVTTFTLNTGSVATGSTYRLVLKIKDSTGYYRHLPVAMATPSQQNDGGFILRTGITVQEQPAGGGPWPKPAGQQRLYTFGSGTNVLVFAPADTADRATMKDYFLFNFPDNSKTDSTGAVSEGVAKKIKDGWSGVVPVSGGDTARFWVVTMINNKTVIDRVDEVLDSVFNNWSGKLLRATPLRNSWVAYGTGAEAQARYLLNKNDFSGQTRDELTTFDKAVSIGIGDHGVDGEAYWSSIGVFQWWFMRGNSSGSGYPYLQIYYDAIYNKALSLNKFAKTKSTDLTSVGLYYSAAVVDSATSILGTTKTTNIYKWIADPFPITDAGTHQTLYNPTTSTSLVGTKSIDNDDGLTLTYAWSKILGGSATIVSPTAATTSVTGMAMGNYRFRLLTTDVDGNSHADTINVVISDPRYIKSIDRRRVFNMQGFKNPDNLVDGSTSSKICINAGNDSLAYPGKYYYELDSTFNNTTYRFYTSGATTPTINVTLFNEQFTDSFEISGVGVSNNWVYLDTTTTSALWFPIRFIQLRVTTCTEISELEFSGRALNVAPYNWRPDARVTPGNGFKEFFGANINGDEKDSLLNAFNNTRINGASWYYDSAVISVTSGNHIFILDRWGNKISTKWATIRTHQDGSKRFMFLYMDGASAANMKPQKPYDPAHPGFPDIYTYYAVESQDRNMPTYGIDTLNPQNHKDDGMMAGFMAAALGKNVAANLNLYNFTQQAGGNIVAGMDLMDGVEGGNEDMGNWKPRDEYESPEVAFIKASVEWDGHKGVVAKSGTRFMDSTFKFIMAAQTFPDTNRIKALSLESYRRRGRDQFPGLRSDGVNVGVLAFNHYVTTTGGQNITPSKGQRPEAHLLYQWLGKMVSLRDEYLPGMKLWWTEEGYDASPNTNYSANVIPGVWGRRTAADWNIRSFHVARAAGIDAVFQYRARDETDFIADSLNGVDFGTAGQFIDFHSNPVWNGYRWPLSYWMSTTLSVYGKYTSYKPEIIVPFDSVNVWVLKDPSIPGYDTVTLTLCKGSANNSSTTMTVPLSLWAGGTIQYAERVDMLFGDKDGVRTPLLVSSGNVTNFQVGETVVSIRAVIQSTQSFKTKRRYRN